MISWLKDLGDVVYDDSHIVLTHEQFDRLDGYENIGQPTSPSVGRVFRTGNRGHRKDADGHAMPGLVVIVEADPEPGYVLRRGLVPLFL